MSISFTERNSSLPLQHKQGFRMYKNPKTNPYLQNFPHTQEQVVENDNVINESKINFQNLKPVVNNPVTKTPEKRTVVTVPPSEQWSDSIGSELNQSINLDDFLDMYN